MALMSGPATFSRFKVLGGSPKRLDDNLLEKLRAHLIGKQRAVRMNDEEVGWSGGRHLLDREFDVEKNIILDCVKFGLRIDTSRIPADLMNAYVVMEWESIVKSGKPAPKADGEHHNSNGNGHAKAWKQAREAAKRRAEAEAKDGRYRRQRQFPVLWDTGADMLYVSATQTAVHERLWSLFRETFDKRLELLTAGKFAYDFAEKTGVSRTIENLSPSRFVTNPDGDEHTGVYWSTNDPASRDYLGNEFLLWLWYMLDEEGDSFTLADNSTASVMVVKKLTLDCPWAMRGRLSIAADGPARLPESRLAISTGKLPRSAGLILSRDGEQYEFTLQAESLAISAATLPKPEEAEDALGNNAAATLQSRAEYRIEQIRELSRGVDQLYELFLKLRLSSAWGASAEKISAWLKVSGKPAERREPVMV
jgi:hypothetical protein